MKNIIIVLSITFLVSCGGSSESTDSRKTGFIEYDFAKVNENLQAGRYIAFIRIKDRLDSNKMKEVSNTEYLKLSSGYKNVMFFFLLPGMVPEKDAYAVVEYKPLPVVTILSRVVEPSTVPGNVVSAWESKEMMNEYRLSLTKEGDSTKLFRTNPDGETYELILSDKSTDKAFMIVDYGEDMHYKIETNGNLGVYDHAKKVAELDKKWPLPY